MKKLRKVTRINVFDFDSHQNSYAISSNKNKFGYSYKNVYYFGNRKLYESSYHDKVYEESIYFDAFGMNSKILLPLKKKIEKLCKKNELSVVYRTDDMIDMLFEDLSSITYHGKHKDSFERRVLRKSFMKK